MNIFLPLGILLLLSNLVTLFVLCKNRDRRQNKLKQSESIVYQRMLEAMGDAVITTDSNSCIVKMNSVAEKLTGWKNKDAINQELTKVLTLKTQPKSKSIQQRISEVLEKRKKQFLPPQTKIIDQDGRSIQLKICIAPANDKKDTEQRALIVFRNTSYRNDLEHQVEKNQQRIQSIYRASPTAIGMLVNRIFYDVNPMFTKMTGYELRDVIGKDARVLYESEEEFLWVGEEKYRQIQNIGIGEVKTRWVCKDNTIIDIVLSSSPVDLDDLSKGVVFSALDISDLQKTQEALRASEKNLKQAQSFAGLGSWEWDLVNNQSESSEELYRIFGYIPHGTARLLDYWPQIVHPDDLPMIREKMDQGIKSGKEYEVEFRIIRQNDGKIRWISGKTGFVQNEKGETTKAYGILYDFTDKKNFSNELEKTETRYQTALEGVSDGVWIWNPTTNETFLSKGWKSMLGYEDDELENKFSTWKELTLNEDVKQFEDQIDALIKGKTDIFENEFRMKHKDGNIIHVLSKAVGNRDEYGNLIDLMGTHVNITKQKTILEELNKIKKRFETAFLYHSTPMTIFDPIEKKRIFVNESYAKLTGYSREDLLIKDFNELNVFPNQEHVNELIKIIIQKGHVSDIFLQIVNAKGEIKEIKGNATVLIDSGRKLILSSGEDITGQKEAEKEKLDSRKRLELALQIGNISISDWSPLQDNFYSDEKYIDFLGYDKCSPIRQIKSIKDRWELLLHEEDKAKIQLFDQLINNPEDSRFDTVFRMKTVDGNYKWIRAIVNAIEFDSNNTPTRFIGIHVDIDKAKSQEFEAIEHREKVMKADKLSTLGTLAAGVAHEINNPNQFILSNISLLEATWNDIRDILDEWVSEHGSDIEIAGFDYEELRNRYPQSLLSMKKGSRRIKTIVQELKDYVRENQSENFTTVDINKVIYSSQILTANLGKKKTDSFSWEHQPKLFVKGNSQKLEQVLVNLIMNAFESLTEKSQSVKVKSYSDNDGHVIIDIIDEGVGIDQKNVEKIRDPFFTTKQSTGGTGMGLSVVDSIIKEHKGELKIIPNEDKGTCVRVILSQTSQS